MGAGHSTQPENGFISLSKWLAGSEDGCLSLVKLLAVPLAQPEIGCFSFGDWLDGLATQPEIGCQICCNLALIHSNVTP